VETRSVRLQREASEGMKESTEKEANSRRGGSRGELSRFVTCGRQGKLECLKRMVLGGSRGGSMGGVLWSGAGGTIEEEMRGS